jgi:hypothetical protein
MTMPRLEVIMSVERRRRWSQEEKERSRKWRVRRASAGQRCTRFLGEVYICRTNNAAERLPRGLVRIVDTQQSQLTALLPWNWKAQSARLAA